MQVAESRKIHTDVNMGKQRLTRREREQEKIHNGITSLIATSSLLSTSLPEREREYTAANFS